MSPIKKSLTDRFYPAPCGAPDALGQEAIGIIQRQQERERELREEIASTQVVLNAVLQALREAQESRERAILLAIETVRTQLRSVAFGSALPCPAVAVG